MNQNYVRKFEIINYNVGYKINQDLYKVIILWTLKERNTCKRST